MSLALDRPPGFWARALCWLARLLLPLPAEPPRAIRSVLVVRTDDRVGNALLTVPFVRALQAALPDARVDLLLAARRASVAEGLPNLSIVRFDKFSLRTEPRRFLRELFALRRRYDVVFDAAHAHAFSVTSALLSRWAARAWVVGWRRGFSGIYSVAIIPLDGPDVIARLRLGDALGLRLTPAAMETALGRGAPPLAPPFIALNPGARKADHRAPAARFAALARELYARRGVRSAVFWGPGEEDLARAVVAGAAEAAFLAPPTDLEALAASFRAAALVVTNDTGPMHLAVACGAKVLAFFLDDAGLRWSHPGSRFAAVIGEAPALDAAVALLDSAGAAEEAARSPREALT